MADAGRFAVGSLDHVELFVLQLCAALCLAGEGVGQSIGEAEFGDIFSHVDRLVQYMREHPSITTRNLGSSSGNGAGNLLLLNRTHLFSRLPILTRK